MNITRYQTPRFFTSTLTPLARLGAFQQDVERILDLPVFGRSVGRAAACTPAIDLHQDKENLFVHVELPGMKKEDVTLSLHEDLLTITGERHPATADPAPTTLRNERFFGRFERTISLPASVDAARVSAAYTDGILTVTLPKAEAAEPRQIEIDAK